MVTYYPNEYGEHNLPWELVSADFENECYEFVKKEIDNLYNNTEKENKDNENIWY